MMMMCIRVRSCECDQCCRCYRNKGKDRCCSCSCIHVNSKVEIFFIQSWFNLIITKFVDYLLPLMADILPELKHLGFLRDHFIPVYNHRWFGVCQKAP